MWSVQFWHPYIHMCMDIYLQVIFFFIFFWSDRLNDHPTIRINEPLLPRKQTARPSKMMVGRCWKTMLSFRNDPFFRGQVDSCRGNSNYEPTGLQYSISWSCVILHRTSITLCSSKLCFVFFWGQTVAHVFWPYHSQGDGKKTDHSRGLS